MNKENFYKTLNDIVGNERLSNEEAYIINDYVGYLEMNNKELTRLYKYEHEYGSYMEDKYIDEKQKNDKTTEYIEELISDTKGTLNDMRYCDKRVNITRFIEDLETDIKHYEYAIAILKGSDKEC